MYGNESNKENWVKFTLKLDDGIKSLQDLSKVRRKIAKILGLKPLTLHLCNINKGCVKVLEGGIHDSTIGCSESISSF